jgi:ribosomal protein S12 methylthiotransferase
MRLPAVAPSRVYIHTLGCPKNEADSRGLARSLLVAGVSVTDDPAHCTHIVINTCGFIQDAKEESIAAILEACAEYGGERVLVRGCLVERYRVELEADIPEVGGWFGLTDNACLVDAVRAGVKVSPSVATTGSTVLTGEVDVEGATGKYAATPAPTVCPLVDTGRPVSYAYIKISDGCDELCTFCAIPAIKGPYYSVDTAAILAEVDACLREGVREIVLVGQDTAVWRDGDRDLSGLLRLLATDERVRRLRVLYLQPEHVGDDLLQCMAEVPKLCRYLDIPLQHAEAEILRRMGRWGDGRAYRELLARARCLMPDVSMRSTFIVGFPGETEDQFQVLMDFVDDIAFDHAGGFIYSPEEGTRAATLRPRVRRREAMDRLNRLTGLIAARAQIVHERLIGSPLEVMIDVVDPDEGEDIAAVGRTEGQAPEVDGVTYIEGKIPPGLVVGDVVTVTITDAVGHDLIGRCDLGTDRAS